METADQQNPSPVFLLLDGGVAYELMPDSELKIGRLDSNDVVLDDLKVSREHAVLKFHDDVFTLTDLASTQGTFLNGERIKEQVVQFGDKILISDYELMLSAEPTAESDDATPKVMRAQDRRLKFFGGLNDFSLITLVQLLSQEKQTGMLRLEVGPKQGPRLYFQEGEIIHVNGGENLAELLTRQHHEQSLYFYFHHETNFPARTIMESTAPYLMNMCQAYDLLQQKVAHVPARRAAVTRQINLPR